MSRAPVEGGGGPDWAVIGTALAALATIAGAGAAAMKGAFGHSRQMASDQDQHRAARDQAATADATRTLESVFRLVDQLQEEVTNKSNAIVASDLRCTEGMRTLESKIAVFERKVPGLEREVKRLEQEVRKLRGG